MLDGGGREREREREGGEKEAKNLKLHFSRRETFVGAFPINSPRGTLSRGKNAATAPSTLESILYPPLLPVIRKFVARIATIRKDQKARRIIQLCS